MRVTGRIPTPERNLRWRDFANRFKRDGLIFVSWEALSAKETQQGNSDSDAKLQSQVSSFSFQKLGPLGTISEQKTRRLRNARLR